MVNVGGGSGRIATTMFKCLVWAKNFTSAGSVSVFNEFRPGQLSHSVVGAVTFRSTRFAEFIPGNFEHPVIISIDKALNSVVEGLSTDPYTHTVDMCTPYAYDAACFYMCEDYSPYSELAKPWVPQTALAVGSSSFYCPFCAKPMSSATGCVAGDVCWCGWFQAKGASTEQVRALTAKPTLISQPTVGELLMSTR